MAINLNDSSFDGSNVAIFNNGTAGIVDHVTLSITKKGNDDKENSPDFKIVFTDKAGAYTNMAFWYVTADSQYATKSEQTQKQGKVLKHLVHAIYGSTYEFPSYADAKTMLSGIMKLLNEALAQGEAEFRVFANYGTNSSTKQYIQVRTWVPFIEVMEVPEGESRLKPGNLDAMAQLVEDASVTSNGQEAVTAEDDW